MSLAVGQPFGGQAMRLAGGDTLPPRVNAAVTTTSRIFLTVQSLSGVTTPQPVAVIARTATSFTIKSANTADTSSVGWFIVEPA